MRFLFALFLVVPAAAFAVDATTTTDQPEKPNIQWDKESTSDPTASLPEPLHAATPDATDSTHAGRPEAGSGKEQWIDVDPATRRTIVNAWLAQPETTRVAFPNYWRQWRKTQKSLPVETTEPTKAPKPVKK